MTTRDWLYSHAIIPLWEILHAEPVHWKSFGIMMLDLSMFAVASQCIGSCCELLKRYTVIIRGFFLVGLFQMQFYNTIMCMFLTTNLVHL